MTKNEKMAGILFPSLQKTMEEWLRFYPPRDLPEGAKVTRFAPSPTGFLHIGGLFSALASERSARLSGGRFLLRIEDTDKKREMEDGVTGIVMGLSAFGLFPDEGMTGPHTEKGPYGPYLQSMRREMYASFACQLVLAGKAYPCFMTPEELDAVRAEQEEKKELPGCYGPYARCRDMTPEQVEERIRRGETPVIRLRSPGTPDGRVTFHDRIKGPITMPENISDVVLLKSDGLPTYHFAHVVDDTLMRVTHVIRGDEWLASAPIHLQLFDAFGLPRPVFSHIAPILKDDAGGRRKISKRKDPEAAVTYFLEEGYPPEAVTEYLLTLLNSDFEDWRREHPDAPQPEFPFGLEKMSASGALFDLAKLADVSKTVVAKFSADQVADGVLAWAARYNPDFYRLISGGKELLAAFFAIDRGGDKPRKDIAKWADVPDYISYLYDETFTGFSPLPDNLSPADAMAILAAYKAAYDETLEKNEWFCCVKELCPGLGFAPEVKHYKKNPGAYKGHVGDVSTVIRIAATGRRQTPDLCGILKLLGKDRFFARADRFIKILEGKS